MWGESTARTLQAIAAACHMLHAARFLRRGRAGITLARMPAHTLPAFLAAAPGALLDRDRPLAYAALADEGARLAGALRELGVRAGDRVALWLPNVPAFALRILVGQVAEVVVNGSKVSSSKVQRAGFSFRFPELETALEHILRNG